MKCMRSAPGAALGFAVAGSLLLMGAQAAGAAKPVVEEVLDILRDEGRISPERYTDLLERYRAEQAQAQEQAQAGAQAQSALPAVSAPAEKDPKGWTASWNNGLRIERNDGYHKIKLGGRIMNDWAVIYQDDGLVDAGSNWITGTELRRARLYVEGTLFDRMIFKTQYDFAGGQVALKDVYVGMKDLGPIDESKVGHFKEPFSLEELTSSKYITFMERALPNVFAPSRNTGAGIQMAPLEGRMTWAVGGFRQTDDSGDGFGSQGNYHLTTRLTGLPMYEGEGERLIHLGLSYSHQFWDSTDIRYRQRPEMHMADRLVDTMAIAGVHNADLFDPEFAWVCGPFSLQSEFLGSLLQPSGGPDAFLWGTYVEASYFLTGEHRAYKTSEGAFDRVSPAHNFDLGEGHWGAFQVAARYSYLDLNDAFVSGGKEDDFTAGFNWYLFPNARVMLNYVYGRVQGQGSVNGGQTRFQLDF
jgi:phosphate-selective porin OprO/OprP